HRLDLDEELLRQYLQSIRKAKKKYQLGGEIDVSLFARLPDLFHVREVEADKASEKESVFAALESALQKLELSREREGRQLKSDMQLQLKHLKKVSSELELRASEIGTRLQKVPGLPENNDLEPSGVANWVLKGDINEEVVRLKGHL